MAASHFQEKGVWSLRVLMWLAIGFTAACAAGVYLSTDIWLAAVCFMLAVGLLLVKRRFAKIAALVMLGAAIGSIWLYGYDCFYLSTAKQYDDQTVNAVVTVTDYGYETGYGTAADGKLYLEDKEYAVRMYLNESDSMSPGDRVVGEFRLRLTTKDAVRGQTYHQGDGIFLLVYTTGEVNTEKDSAVSPQYFAAELRHKIIEILDSTFPMDVCGFARALLLGDSTELDYETDTAFKLSGIRHIIAVSGLHVSILFSLICLLCVRRRFLIVLIGIPVLVLFAGVAGFTPSVVRACIMQGLMILALLFKKEYDPPTALSFAVLFMLGVNPMTITSVSFQLSVGCLVGIFLFYQRINGWLVKCFGVERGMTVKARLLRWLCGSVAVTLSATVATTPLSAWYFGTVSLAGVFTNLLTLWVVSFVFYGIMLVCILGIAWTGVATAVAAVVAWPIRYVIMIARVMSGSVFSAVYTCSIYIVVWLVLCYLLLGVFILSKRKRAGLLTLCMTAGLVCAVACSWVEPRLDDCRVTVFDVGQGQSILLQAQGRNYLVDCGGDSDEAAADTVCEMLLSQGITHIDGLILTHYDKDHSGGAIPLLSRMETQQLYLPNIADDGGVRSILEQKQAKNSVLVDRNMELTWEQSSISLIPAARDKKGNESCLSILFQTENCDILITGDLGRAGEQTLVESGKLPELELLVVGHHGSADATSLPLLSATKPVAAVISVGRNNSYGHPSEDVLYRLRLFGCHIWRTDLDGTIIFRG